MRVKRDKKRKLRTDLRRRKGYRPNLVTQAMPVVAIVMARELFYQESRREDPSYTAAYIDASIAYR